MAQLSTMQFNVSETLAKKQARYERYFDKKTRCLPVFTVAQMVCVNRSPLTTLTADWETSVKNNKLLPRNTGPFKVLNIW